MRKNRFCSEIWKRRCVSVPFSRDPGAFSHLHASENPVAGKSVAVMGVTEGRSCISDSWGMEGCALECKGTFRAWSLGNSSERTSRGIDCEPTPRCEGTLPIHCPLVHPQKNRGTPPRPHVQTCTRGRRYAKLDTVLLLFWGKYPWRYLNKSAF